MFSRRTTPFVATATRLPAPAPSVLFPNPLATIITPLSAGDFDRREPESVLVTIARGSVADDNAGIADRPRDGQDLETALGHIAERVEVVHFVADIKKSVFGIVGGHGRTDDHSVGIHAVTDNTVRSGGVTAERSQIGNGKSYFGASRAKGGD